VKTVEEYLRKVASTQQRDWDEMMFLLAYRPSTHETAGMTPANMVFGMELRLPCDLLFGAPPDMEESTGGYATNLAERLRDMHHFSHQQLKVASDRTRAQYDRLANSAGFQEEDRVWL
jgi:hypothetical protein